MTSSNNHPVIADGRIDGDKECFYCKSPVGSQHLDGCVQRRRTVLIEYRILVVRDEPESQSPEDIEHRYNDGSWCADSFGLEINRLIELQNGNDSCLCGQLSATFIREATADDEQTFGVLKDN